MIPRLKKRIVRVPYWDCGMKEHTHQTEDDAIACLKSRGKYGVGNPHKWLREELLAANEAGERQSDMARRLGVTRARISALIREAKEQRDWERMDAQADAEFNELGSDSICLLKAMGLYSVNDLRNCLAQYPDMFKTHVSWYVRRDIEAFMDRLNKVTPDGTPTYT